VAAIEFLPVTPRLRRAISARPPVDELREVAVTSGLATMRRGALELVQAGRIAFEELAEFLTLEQLAPGAGDLA
jgi:type II secretory ATPase GspE/PulE/Tfp pilus assembly ATPase PilB-like protein